MNNSSKFESSCFRSKCKLCIEALEDHELQNIVTTDINKQIFEIFRENISPFGNLSDKLCSSCFTKIQSKRDIESFKKHVIQKQDQLRNDLQPFVDMTKKLEFKENKTSKKEEPDKDMNRTQIIKKDSPELLILEIGNENQFQDETASTRRRPSRKVAPRSSNVRNEKKFTCDFCAKRFWWKSKISKHLKTHIRDNRENPCSTSKVYEHKRNFHLKEPTKKFTCPSCEMKFLDVLSLKNHFDVAHQINSHECHDCEQIFFSAKSLNLHIIAVHYVQSKNKHFQCSLCGQTFGLKQLLKIHIDKKHVKKNICKVLGSSGAFNSTNFKYRIVSKSDIFKCEYEGCNKVFISAEFLKTHKQKHVKPNVQSKDFICQYEDCGEACDSAMLLMDHVQNCHIKFQMHCTIIDCKYKNSYKEQMRRHICDRHSNLLPKEYRKLKETVENMQFLK